MLDNKRSNRVSRAPQSVRIFAIAAAVAAAAALAFVLLDPMGSDAAQTKGPAVSTKSTSLGRILVNVTGHTLYIFSRDKNDRSACTGMCAKFWPPLIATAKPRALAGVRASLLGTTKRTDGRKQVTYNRHPLYTFVKDKNKGQTNGEGLTAFGGQWHAISPAGTEVLRRPKPKPPVNNGIPQNNGGDGDSDNNGGPSDGDGNI